MIKKEIKYWGIAILALLIISIIITFLGYPFLKSLRAVFGLVYVLFLPGFVVTMSFYKEDNDWIQIAALSMGLSIALVILSVMISNMVLQVPITPLTNFLVILLVMLITLLIKKYQNELKSKLLFWKK
jgi:uncharacterized membrane protein